MKLRTANDESRAAKNGVRKIRTPYVLRRSQKSAAFTLAEVLAALVFMAIVIPVVAEALRVASLSGEVAVRKAEAVRVGDRILNESIVTTNWQQSSQSGTVSEGLHDFTYTLNTQEWPQDQMDLITVEVGYKAQGKDYSVRLSTLASQSSAYPATNNAGQ